MADVVWPPSLPQFVQESGYSESLPDQTIETSMSAGPPKIRRRFTASFRPIQCTIMCTAAQAETFETFDLTTLRGGSLPFDWVNPRTQTPATFRFRKPVPQYSPFGGNNVMISMRLERIPG